MAGHLLLLCCADNFDDTQLIADRLPGVVGQCQPDPVAVQDPVTGRVDAASALADRVITSPVVTAMAVGTGTRRAVQRLRGNGSGNGNRKKA